MTQLKARAGRREVDGWLWRFRRKQAAEDSSSKGCSDLIASASRALQLERVESQKRLPRESCNCVGLSAKLRRATLGRSRALGLRKRSSRAELLCLRLPKAGKGPTAEFRPRPQRFQRRSCRHKAQLRRLEPKAFLWGSRALATSLGRLAAGSFIERADDCSGEGCSDLVASRALQLERVELQKR